MRLANSEQRRRRFGRAILFAIGLVQVLAMKAGLAQDKRHVPVSVPEDWTNHHVIFSGARTAEDARRLAADRRYLNQWLLHNYRPGTGPEAAAARVLNDPDFARSLASSVQPDASSTKGKP